MIWQRKLTKGSFETKLEKSFLFRAQAVFYGRLAIGLLYSLLFILSLTEGSSFPCTFFDALLILLSFFYSFVCYRLKNHARWGRWAHFITLVLDLIINIIFSRNSGLLLSPLMALHPLFTAMFLLLFHNPLMIITPLLTLPFYTVLTLISSETNTLSLIYALLLYCTLDALIIFFIHLAQSQEQRILKSLVTLEKKMKELALTRERSRIARDFHDGIGAQLTSIIMQCDYLVMKLKERPVLRELQEIRECAIFSMEDMRRSIALLHNDFDISEQLTRMCENMRERHQIKVEMRGIHFLTSLAIEQQIACCRIVQEGLTNTLKHAKANSIIISAARDEESVSLTIRDDGLGFKESQSERHHFGLSNMHDRARNIGGNLVIRSEPRLGTEIVLSIAHGGFF